MKLGQAEMGDFEVDQRLWDHAIGLAAPRQHRIGDHPHQAATTAAIDETDAALGHRLAKHPRERHKAGSVPMLEPQ